MTAVRPTEAALEVVWPRDLGCCAVCGDEIFGERGLHWSLHHRRAAGMGGDRRPETHAPGNLVLLHGSGVTDCHGRVESNRTEAKDRGWLIPKNATQPPCTFPIDHAVHGRVWLTDDGLVLREAPE